MYKRAYQTFNKVRQDSLIHLKKGIMIVKTIHDYLKLRLVMFSYI